MRRPRLPTARVTTATLAAALVLSACAGYNPFGSRGDGYAAPRELGEGDCATEVRNNSGRPLEAYYYLGLRNPPRVTAGWPRVGLLEPGESTIVYGDCELRRITVHAYAAGPVDLSREYRDIRRSAAMVEGRREVIRLRLSR